MALSSFRAVAGVVVAAGGQPQLSALSSSMALSSFRAYLV
jgi:hypothetical protein